ncbi:MAG TPA: hypothetical protein VK843_21900 [Planctomycetota bacterium]|nr:hypothetical protein [Planctomycetota bacterium]
MEYRVLMMAFFTIFLLGLPLVQDPAAPAPVPVAAGFDELLRAQPFFKKILWTTDSSAAPFEIVIQKQAVPEAGYEASVASYYGPWLVQMAKVFETSFAAPLALPPGLSTRPPRLIVLLTEGDYVNYTKSVATWDGWDSSAYYDERIRAVVTHWDMSWPPNVRRYMVLRRMVFALLQQRSTGFESRQPPLWLREGLGRSLAWHIGPDAATAFAKADVDPQLARTLVSVSQDVAQQNRFLLPIDALVGITSFAELRRHAMHEARDSGFEFNDNDPWHSAFNAESGLWVHFLRREGAKKHNDAFAEYCRACMRGGGSQADFRKAFEGQDLTELDREFYRWVYARVREIDHAKPDDAKLATLFVKPKPSEKGVAGATTPSSSGAAIATQLALPEGDLRIVRALALSKAAAGELEAAILDLGQAIDKGGDDGDVARLRTERERMSAWKTARDLWLAELVKSGGKLQLERNGKTSTRRATAFADGSITLESPQGKETVAVSSVPPAAIAAQMKPLPAGTPEWARAYGYVLGDDPRWDKQLKDKSEPALALRADATAVYLELRRLGKAASHLKSLAASTAPADKDSATWVLDELRATMRELPLQQIVFERSAALRDLGILAAGIIYEETKPLPTFAGKTTWVDADTLELGYEFDSAAELDDWWQRTPPASERVGWEPIVIPESAQGFGVKDGAWTGRGSTILAHKIPFEAPIHVIARLRHGYAERDDVSLGHFRLEICRDPERGFLGFNEWGQSILEEFKTGKQEYQEPSVPTTGVPLGDQLTLEVVYSGTTTRFVHHGTEEPSLPKSSLRDGEVCVISHANRVVLLDSIVIRGKLNAASRAKMREMWIARTVKEAGL